MTTDRADQPLTGGNVRAIPLAASLDDAGLARAIASGHPGAARAAFDRFGGLVRGLLVRSIGPGADVDDLVQDTFLLLFRRASTLRDPSVLSSFVVGIALRVARAELRRRRVRRILRLAPTDELPEISAQGVDPQAREALRRLYAILDRLDTDVRLAFVLRRIDGKEVAEVAELLGCSLATAKRRIARGVERVTYHAQRDPALSDYIAQAAGVRRDSTDDMAPRDEEGT